MDDFRLSADWSVGQGARVAVLGPSGAGKSTLLMMLAGFVAPTSGAVRWGGQDLSRTPPDRRPMTILFQDQNLFPHLTLAQNLGLGISPRLRLSRADHARIAAVLDRVGLAGLEARRPAQVSGGQQGRAALARALLRDRPVLLLDEPFAALGPALKAEMLDLVLDTAAEKTVLMVTHDPADARRMGGTTVVVADGSAHPPAPTKALLADPPPALRDYLG
ncbi:ATP-binding cassette domain-containing protein [Falsirhodobacter halotolerans]|uniref:thiamine ABC transporter ATP-binding protein n=1 Tax=Falsirhodobacter halotolerans TaxID=1146892 RepID=UPI001FD50A72|nr:ATP-binding cassette domain-containing protein [Falsirhodobacter halotolerans]MCJ8138261.1 ATP-binding cassette domain-containing protein [Falsirhodobacter halotolerans]